MASLLVLRRLPLSTMPKVKRCGKKKPVKHKDLPSLSSDEDHPTPSVDIPVIISTPVELLPAEVPTKKEKKTRQLTVEEEDDIGQVAQDKSLYLQQQARYI